MPAAAPKQTLLIQGTGTGRRAIALREVLVNALAHADYSRHGRTIKVALFSNRIEVENPGGWPLGLGEEDFRNGVSRARNPVIVGVLHKLTIMENWGSGFERIETDARQLGYALPLWEDKGTVLRAKLLPHSALASTMLFQVPMVVSRFGKSTRRR